MKSIRRNLSRRQVLIGVALVLCLAAMIAFLNRVWSRESVERRLVAIYTAHAVTPEENAATIYSRLLAAYLPERLRVPAPGLPTDSNSIFSLLFSEEERTKVLLEAAKRPQCFFAALCDSAGPVAAMRWMRSTTSKRTSMMRMAAWPLLAAALDDLAQGRLNAAKEKLHCMARIAAHLRQQPTSEDFFTARMIEDYLWSALGEFIVERDATDERLAVIEEILPSLADVWEEESADMRQVETLLDTQSAWKRLDDAFEARGLGHLVRTCELDYHQTICERRGMRILIELRRYRNQSGRWPNTLDEIRAQLPPEALSDPLGGGEMVYELEPGGFHLYSMGRDNKKDVGKGDDYTIWARRGTLKWLQERQWETPQAAGGQSTQRRR